MEPAGAAALRAFVRLLRRDRRGDELAGQPVERGVIVLIGRPLAGGSELAAAPQGSAFPPGILPPAGSFADAPAGPQSVHAALDPGPQPEPAGKQGIMSDLRRV